MNKMTIFSMLLALFPTASLSGQTGRVTSIHTYRTVDQTTSYREVCDHQNDSDVLIGTIIGGIVGNEITNSSEGTILGAIIGGSIASENRPRNSGCRIVQVNNNEFIEYYKVVARTSDGNYRSFTTTNHTEIGDIVHFQ